MAIIPLLKARQIVTALLRLGFFVVRQRGSHIRLRHHFDPTRHVTVPNHAREVSPRILGSILKQAKTTLQEFLKALR